MKALYSNTTIQFKLYKTFVFDKNYSKSAHKLLAYGTCKELSIGEYGKTSVNKTVWLKYFFSTCNICMLKGFQKYVMFDIDYEVETGNKVYWEVKNEEQIETGL